jgi:hypothetical protein
VTLAAHPFLNVHGELNGMKAALLLVVGIVGLIQTLLPRAVVRACTKVVFRDAGDAEPREWVYVLGRVEGAVLVLVSIVGLFRVATAGGDEGEDGSTAVGEETDE